MFTLENAIAGKIANTPISELKNSGATREILLQVGFNAADLDVVFTVATPTFGVSTSFLKSNGIRGTERSYILPNMLLNQKIDATLQSAFYALSAANKLIYPNLATVLKTESAILAAKTDGTIIKYSSVGCFRTSDNKEFRMGILDDVINRLSNEYTLYCSKKADPNSATRSYDVVEILER